MFLAGLKFLDRVLVFEGVQNRLFIENTIRSMSYIYKGKLFFLDRVLIGKGRGSLYMEIKIESGWI